MNIQHVPAPEGETGYALFSANFFLGDRFYKMAAAETFSIEGKRPCAYRVLLSSREGIDSFRVWKDGAEGWQSDFLPSSEEKLRIIGALIEDAQNVECPVFDL